MKQTELLPTQGEIHLLQLENQSLQTQVTLLSARLEKCERKKRILEANKN